MAHIKPDRQAGLSRDQVPDIRLIGWKEGHRGHPVKESFGGVLTGALQVISDDHLSLIAQEQQSSPVEHWWAKSAVAVMRAGDEVRGLREPPPDVPRAGPVAQRPRGREDALVLTIYQDHVVATRAARSEERRVGKECRARWWRETW